MELYNYCCLFCIFLSSIRFKKLIEKDDNNESKQNYKLLVIMILEECYYSIKTR